VVLVEDEEPVRQAVERALRREGVTVTAFADYPGPDLVLAAAPDLAVLDVLLPSGDGFELARELRAARDLPIVFLTARDTVEDRLGGFELGADDYLVKPFALEELLARIRAVLRRSSAAGVAPQIVEAGEIRLNPQTREAWYASERLDLTMLEFDILDVLVRSAGRVVSRDELTAALYQRKSTPYERSLDVHISHLRKKLERQNRNLIQTIRGVGYRFSAGTEVSR
jgi:two-component system response regulator CpxR